ncbi:MAG: hypothetical protein IJ221_03435 [Oscillibacter sp.]|nr:hypothetical protein [Oscillibacter sp.]
MKNKIALMLSALLLAGMLAGCGTKTADPAPDTPAPAEEVPSGAYSPDGSVIFEKDGLKVTTAGLDTDLTSIADIPIIWVDIENSGGEDVYLGVDNGSVNGFMTTVVLIEFYDEAVDGYIGGSSEFGVAVPAGEGVRRALGYYGADIPGVDPDTLAEMEFSFTTAEDEYSWRNYVSEPVVIRTGETMEDVDLSALGTVVIDDDRMTVVFGEQDYDDWFGPQFTVYVENKTDQWIGLYPESAEGDGISCDYMYGAAYIAPGKKAISDISFDGELRERRGVETLTLHYRYCEADSSEGLDLADPVALDPITVTYPPQVWGEYENGGLTFEVKPKYNDLVTVETPQNDPDGTLFTVSETASLEAGGYEGAGWLRSIARVGEDKLHEMLCYDMSGANVFAMDEDGNYYVKYYPTDVRFERATVEEMQRDQEQWTMLNEWADSAVDSFMKANGLESKSFSNTPVDMYLARAAWDRDVNAALSTTEYGPVGIAGVDGTPYAEQVMGGWFWEADIDEAPDGESVVLNFPDEGVRLDFFFAPGAYVRLDMGDHEELYESVLYDATVAPAEIMRGWYYAACEKAGVKGADASLNGFVGTWYEKIAGRGEIVISRSLAPGRANIVVRWPESASVVDTWEMTAKLEDGKLVYENGEWEVVEFDDAGNDWVKDSSYDESGYFDLDDTGDLNWHDDNAERGGDSVFIK